MRAAAFLLLLLLVAAPIPAQTLEEGVLGEAPFRLAVPDRWEGGVLLVAHGWRPPDAPVVAVLDTADPVYSEYLRRGWLVAASGYRRNGWILEDAAEDLVALLDHVAAEFGPVTQVVVEGTSLGANIGLWLAEAEKLRLEGLVAVAADPRAEGPDGPTAWTWNPRVPIIMVSNRNEYDLAEDYAGRVGGDAIRPALWILDRDGHVNLNASERWAAHLALGRWLGAGIRPPGWVGEPFDATVVVDPPASAARPRGDGLEGRVVRVDPVYGNLHTDLVAADLERVAGRPGGRFLVEVFGAREQIVWGTGYSDVKGGRLVALVGADGLVQIAVNRGDAAARLGLRAGDPLEILPQGRKKNDPRN